MSAASAFDSLWGLAWLGLALSRRRRRPSVASAASAATHARQAHKNVYLNVSISRKRREREEGGRKAVCVRCKCSRTHTVALTGASKVWGFFCRQVNATFCGHLGFCNVASPQVDTYLYLSRHLLNSHTPYLLLYVHLYTYSS